MKIVRIALAFVITLAMLYIARTNSRGQTEFVTLTDGEYTFEEKEFNALGYVFLSWEKVDEAIAVFKLNVAEYPKSANVYDSLGEAYMVAKKYDDSIKNYEMALSIEPDNKHSKEQLEKLQVLVTQNN